MSRHAEIVGGGIAGLTAAVALASAGWSVRVHERSPEIREIGAGIVLMNNSLSVFEELGVFDALVRRGTWLAGSDIRDHRGRTLQRRRFDDKDGRIINLPRQELVQELAAAAVAQGAEVVTNSFIQRAWPDGTVEASDGARVKADLVVAADGHRSRVRTSLGLTQTARNLGTGASRLLIRWRETGAMAYEYWSGRRRVGIVPCTPALTYVYLSCPERDQQGRALPVIAETWHRSFPTLDDAFLQALAEASGTRNAYSYVRCRSWSAGRVAVIGDAAHAMPPTLGQGAGLSITNGRALVDTLAETRDVPTALRAWEDRYRWITDHTQLWSLRYEAVVSRWPRSLAFMRTAVIRLFGIKKLNQHMRVADRFVPSGRAGARLPAAT